jgi:hypothetical protein
LSDVLTPALLSALAVASLAGSSNRVVEFPGGRTFVDSLGEADHVLVQDLKGNVKSDSLCDSGRFSDYFVLFIRFRDAIAGGDKEAVLHLLDYPFRVNGPQTPLVFKKASRLSKSYSQVFTAEVQKQIRDAEPAALFCRNGQAILGSGVVWANRSGVAVLNMPAEVGNVANAAPPASENLVLKGKVRSLKRAGDDPLKEWIVTVKIKKVVSGEFSEKTFQFAVHDPAQAGLKKGRSYTIEALKIGDRYSVDELQWMKRLELGQGKSD